MKIQNLLEISLPTNDFPSWPKSAKRLTRYRDLVQIKKTTAILKTIRKI